MSAVPPQKELSHSLKTYYCHRLILEKNKYNGFCLCQLSTSIGEGLVTNYGEGGLQNGRGGVCGKFYPYGKGGGGAEKVLAILKGGTKGFGVLFTR